jgi:hypothetical protein
MEEKLLKNIIFSLPTDGKVMDENWEQIYTFADIKHKLILKDK